MAVIAAAVVGGTFALAGAGISAWANWEGMKASRRESRRTEALNIKFAEKETRRQEKEFARTQALSERKQSFDERQTKFQNVSGALINMQNLFQNNRNFTLNMRQLNRSRI